MGFNLAFKVLTSWWFSYDEVSIGSQERNCKCGNTFIASYEAEAGFDRGPLGVGHVQHSV